MRATAEGKWSGSEQEVHFMLSGKDRGSYSDSSRNNENHYNSDIESSNGVTVKVAKLALANNTQHCWAQHVASVYMVPQQRHLLRIV